MTIIVMGQTDEKEEFRTFYSLHYTQIYKNDHERHEGINVLSSPQLIYAPWQCVVSHRPFARRSVHTLHMGVLFSGALLECVSLSYFYMRRPSDTHYRFHP